MNVTEILPWYILIYHEITFCITYISIYITPKLFFSIIDQNCFYFPSILCILVFCEMSENIMNIRDIAAYPFVMFHKYLNLLTLLHFIPTLQYFISALDTRHLYSIQWKLFHHLHPDKCLVPVQWMYFGRLSVSHPTWSSSPSIRRDLEAPESQQASVCVPRHQTTVPVRH